MEILIHNARGLIPEVAPIRRAQPLSPPLLNPRVASGDSAWYDCAVVVLKFFKDGLWVPESGAAGLAGVLHAEQGSSATTQRHRFAAVPLHPGIKSAYFPESLTPLYSIQVECSVYPELQLSMLEPSPPPHRPFG